jgi:ABC-type transporter Mla subunit MlaD
MSSEYTRSEILSGLFVLLAVAVFGLFAFQVGNLEALAFWRGEGFLCLADFADTKSLQVDAPVRVAGSEVGRVKEIRIAEAELSLSRWKALAAVRGEEAPPPPAGLRRQVVEVVFEIRSPTLRLDPGTALVTLSRDGFLGKEFLSLDPGYWTGQRAPLLAAGLEQPLRLGSKDPTGIDEVVARVEPGLRRIDTILATVQSELLDENNLDLVTSMLRDLASASSEMRALLDPTSEKGVQERIVDPASRLLGSTEESLGRVTRRAEEVMDDLGPRTGKVIDDIGASTEALARLLGDLDAQLTTTMGDLNALLRENRPEVSETMRRLRRTMWEAEMALRKIRANPAYLLFGDDEANFDEVESDESGLRRTGRARPYGQRDEKK